MTEKWTTLLAQNAEWWTNTEAKADQHPIGYCLEDRARILRTNPRFKPDTLVALNQYVITHDSQDGHCDAEYTECFPGFITQQIEQRRVPADFPNNGVLSKEYQRPYVEFLATKQQVAILNKCINPKHAIIICDADECTANRTAMDEAKLHKNRIVVTKVELKKGDRTVFAEPTGMCRTDGRF